MSATATGAAAHSADRVVPSAYWVRGRLDLAEEMFVRLVWTHDLRRLWSERLSIGAEAAGAALTGGGELLLIRRTDAGEVVLTRDPDGTLALIELGRGSATIEIAGGDDAAVAGRRDRVAAALGAAERPAGEVSVTFWAAGPRGAHSARRWIATPAWAAIRGNYAPRSAAMLDELCAVEAARLPAAGRLLVWHGSPGTGKTSALRALTRAWSEWCGTHFVTDPEVFLGASTSYLLDVLTAEPVGRRRTTPPWKLIVLEDSGELLGIDAHMRTNQALARLLNTTDGLIGQGMQVIVLVTTNEPLERLHPAVQRPGRCWYEIEFEPLTAAHATRWLAAAGERITRTRPTVLADLYALLRGEAVDEPPTFGFGAA